MQIHQIKPKTKSKKDKRIGRGGKKGTYSGRGMKGQLSRSGHKKAPVIREIIKKYHKLKGYRFNSISVKSQNVNLFVLQRRFETNDMISPETLVEKGLARTIKGKLPVIKILGNGSLKKNLTVKDCLLSQSAIKKIEEAGGKIIKEYVV